MLKLCSLEVENWLILHPLGGSAGWGPRPTHRALAQAADLAAALVHRVHVHQVVVGAHGQVCPVWGRGRGYEEAPRLHPLLSQAPPLLSQTPPLPLPDFTPSSATPPRLQPNYNPSQAVLHQLYVLRPLSVALESWSPGPASPGSQALRLPGEKLTTEICSLPSVWIATRSWVSVSSSSHL